MKAIKCTTYVYNRYFPGANDQPLLYCSGIKYGLNTQARPMSTNKYQLRVQI